MSRSHASYMIWAGITFAMALALGCEEKKKQPAKDKAADEQLAGTDTSDTTGVSSGDDDASSVDDSADDGSSSTETTPSSEPAAAGNIAAWRQSWDDCATQGKAWKASIGNGAPGCAAEAVATWGCCKDYLLKRFPSVASGLTQKFKTLEGDGYKLYHCSEDATQSYLHFGKLSDRNYYQVVYVKAKAAASAGNGSDCAKLTFDDLVIGGVSPSDDGGSTTSSTTAGGGGEEDVGTIEAE